MSSAAQDSLDTKDEDYSTSKQEENVPVTRDEEVEEPAHDADADSDAQLVRDDQDAIDKDNIIEERTRGAAPKGGYQEPGDEEGLPTDE